MESGTGGDTILKESGVDASMLDEAKDEEPVVTPAIPFPAQGTSWFSPETFAMLSTEKIFA